MTRLKTRNARRSLQKTVLIKDEYFYYYCDMCTNLSCGLLLKNFVLGIKQMLKYYAVLHNTTFLLKALIYKTC